MLRNNSRVSFLDVAKRLSVSESTVRKRVAKMENNGVIKKYTTIIEPSKIGYGSVALVGIDVTPERFLEVGKRLTELENVKFVATSTGDHMLMIEIWMENSSKLRSFISKEIESIEGITRTCPAIINERLKCF